MIGDRMGDSGVVWQLRLARVVTESRHEYVEPEADASESLDARFERAADINLRVSCSVMGDGPGTGGSGVDGGRDSGGLGLGKGVWRALDMGVGGMWDGGTGKEESRSGTALRLAVRRVSVGVVEVMTTNGGLQYWGYDEENGDKWVESRIVRLSV